MLEYKERRNMNEKKSIQELTIKNNLAHTIFLSTKGTNKDEVPPELVRFLEFVGTPLQDSDKDFNDDFIRKLQESIREVKASREMGARYMTFEEYLKEEREEAREEGARNKVVELVKKKLAKGQSVEEIADVLEETAEAVQEIIDELSDV